MKKKLLGFVTIAVAVVGLAACGNSSSDDTSKGNSDDKVLKVGASATPHAEILEQAKPILKKEGIDLQIQIFDDYVLPNKALAAGDIEANYFQHIPYLNKANKDNGFDLVNAGAVHLEPMGLYSQRIKDIKDLKDGATIITSNSESDWGRILTILEDNELIKLKDGVDKETATFDDIAENPKDLKFKHDIDPSLLAATYKNDEADLVAINANYALGIDLVPAKDAVLLEKDNTPYVNIIAVRKGDENEDKIKKLIEALHSEDVEKYVQDKWNGSIKIVPADSK
ncbi:MetQ/NlpA family ABC transporter substrate-binding protein [uncultured Enterococcus sp.]|uniref:MetQ/NlpA family ABC transporter substrate-binding protein n=1 Tax=uncultured Enterococcus sp. TaxID=167972 RepID=UPI0025CFC04B|nr:MetQ/NlpA family ABC transporter substrate-binding protein [uncultured Enterococcus sp.]